MVNPWPPSGHVSRRDSTPMVQMCHVVHGVKAMLGSSWFVWNGVYPPGIKLGNGTSINRGFEMGDFPASYVWLMTQEGTPKWWCTINRDWNHVDLGKWLRDRTGLSWSVNATRQGNIGDVELLWWGMIVFWCFLQEPWISTCLHGSVFKVWTWPILRSLALTAALGRRVTWNPGSHDTWQQGDQTWSVSEWMVSWLPGQWWFWDV